MLSKFVTTTYLLAVTGRWAELSEYFLLMREVLKQPPETVLTAADQDRLNQIYDTASRGSAKLEEAKK